MVGVSLIWVELETFYFYDILYYYVFLDKACLGVGFGFGFGFGIGLEVGKLDPLQRLFF